MGDQLSESYVGALSQRLLAMADDELVLAHRNSEWTGHAPILEEDIAFSNIAQDELGHAGIWYNLLEELTGDEPDQLVFYRGAGVYRNVQMVELPRGDWAFTMLRQYLFDAYEAVLLPALSSSKYRPLAEGAAKIRPEEYYHYRHTSNWIKRLGLGTDESNRRLQKALEQLWPYTQQLFQLGQDEAALVEEGLLPDLSSLRVQWRELTVPFLEQAGLNIPGPVTTGAGDREEHTDHLAEMLTELQEVARLDPEAEW